MKDGNSNVLKVEDDPLTLFTWEDELGGKTWENKVGGKTWEDEVGGKTWEDKVGGKTWEDEVGGKRTKREAEEEKVTSKVGLKLQNPFQSYINFNSALRQNRCS